MLFTQVRQPADQEKEINFVWPNILSGRGGARYLRINEAYCRYTYLRIQGYLDGNFAAFSVHRKQCVGIIFGTLGIPRTSGTVLWYCRVFLELSLCVPASNYTCHPIRTRKPRQLRQ